MWKIRLTSNGAVTRNYNFCIKAHFSCSQSSNKSFILNNAREFLSKKIWNSLEWQKLNTELTDTRGSEILVCRKFLRNHLIFGTKQFAFFCCFSSVSFSKNRPCQRFFWRFSKIFTGLIFKNPTGWLLGVLTFWYLQGKIQGFDIMKMCINNEGLK